MINVRLLIARIAMVTLILAEFVLLASEFGITQQVIQLRLNVKVVSLTANYVIPIEKYVLNAMINITLLTVSAKLRREIVLTKEMMAHA